MNILYVEDDPYDADLTRRELGKVAPHINLEIVTTRRDALARLNLDQTLDYEIVLCDMRLPDASGLDVLTHIRSAALPLAVVIITGAGDEETAVAVLKAGADDYIVKRDDYLARLPTTLDNALQRYRAEVARHMRPLRVLYAEHNASDIDLTYRHLARSAPYIQLDVVNTASELFQRILNGDAGENGYDLLMLDYRLPGMNGLEVLKEVRHVHQLNLPVVLVTGHGNEDMVSHALKLGAADFVIKNTGYLYKLPSVLENAFYRAQLVREQAALRESEEKLRIVFNESLDVFVIVNGTNGRILNVNRGTHRILGYHSADLIGQHFSILFPPDPKLSDKAMIEKLRVHGAVFEAQEFLRADGSLCPMDLTANLIPWEQGKAVLLTLRDVTERKQTEEALQASEERFRQVIASISDHIYVTEITKAGEHINLYVSPNVEDLTGYPRENFATNWRFWPSSVIHPDDRVTAAEQVNRFTQGENSEVEYRMIRADGRTIWVRDSIRVQRLDNSSLIVYGVVSDITERKRLEDQLLQSQKMEAVGRLAGGVAHDFNNLLLVIIGYSELLLQRRLGDQDTANRYIEEIKKAGERAASLTRQLLAFSRKQVFQPNVLNLNRIVADMEKMLRRLVDENIEFVVYLESHLKSVKADPGQIEQVVMNLVVNARDAMPQGGRLTIKTTNIYLDEVYVRQYFDLQAGPYVMLTVSDTGIGIDEEIQPHIFEPFFTTKEVDKGTGLGLATVYGIVKQSGGHISVFSQPDKGTTFRVYLPQVEEVPETSEKLVVFEPPSHGQETILLVEDQKEVRELIRNFLVDDGYNVLEASYGDEALQVSRRHAGPIHLLVTDVVMPQGMSGRELVEQLAPLRPEMKVIYMSGYADDTMVQYRILDSNTAFLQKPFKPSALAHKVRKVLEASQ